MRSRICARSRNAASSMRRGPSSAFDAKRYLSLDDQLYERAESAGVMPLYQWGMAREPREPERAMVRLRGSGDRRRRVRRKNSDGRAGAKASVRSKAPISSSRASPPASIAELRIREAGFEPCFRSVFEQAERLEGAIVAAEVWEAEIHPVRLRGRTARTAIKKMPPVAVTGGIRHSWRRFRAYSSSRAAMTSSVMSML